MKISAREDIQAPIGALFARLTDYATHEAVAARRGVAVERLSLPQEREGRPAWKATFQYGGREREVTIDVTDLHEPDYFASAVTYQGIDAEFIIELVPLAKTRTRMIVGIELKPRSIKAKLIVQSLKIAKTSITKRVENRLKTFGRDLESQVRD